jgi:hypothetical protein
MEERQQRLAFVTERRQIQPLSENLKAAGSQPFPAKGCVVFMERSFQRSIGKLLEWLIVFVNRFMPLFLVLACE